MLARMGPQERDLIVQRELDEGRNVLGPVDQDQQLIPHTVAHVVYAGYAPRAQIDVAAARIVRLLKSRSLGFKFSVLNSLFQDSKIRSIVRASIARGRETSLESARDEPLTDLQHWTRSPAEYIRLQQGDYRQAATVVRLFLVAGSPATYAISLILHGCKQGRSR